MLLSASLYPFDFSIANFVARAQSLRFGPGVFGYSGRGDIVGNLLAYIPFGLLLVLLLDGKSIVARLALTVAAGAALSFTIEVLQLGIRIRYTSPGDFLANTLSTAAGAVTALLYERQTPSGTIARLQRGARSPVVPLLLTVWFAAQAVPFLPRLRIRPIADSLSEFMAAGWFDGSLLRQGASLLLLSALLRAFTRREWFWPVFVATVVGSWLSALVFVWHSLSLSQIIAALAVTPIVIWLRGKPHLTANAPLLWIVSGFLLSGALIPILSDQELIQVSLFDQSGNYAGILERVLLVVGTLWLGASSRIGLLRVTAVVALMFAVAAAVNWRLSGELHFDSTDWLLLGFACLLLHAARGVDWEQGTR